jgi:hypothetical protein
MGCPCEDCAPEPSPVQELRDRLQYLDQQQAELDRQRAVVLQRLVRWATATDLLSPVPTVGRWGSDREDLTTEQTRLPHYG